MSMTALEGKIRSHCMKLLQDIVETKFWDEQLALSIASDFARTVTSSIEEKKPELPITPGEWTVDTIGGDWQVLDNPRDPDRRKGNTVAIMQGFRDDNHANAIAIAALPRLLRTALDVAKYHESLGEPWTSYRLCVELSSALEEAGVKL